MAEAKSGNRGNKLDPLSAASSSVWVKGNQRMITHFDVETCDQGPLQNHHQLHTWEPSLVLLCAWHSYGTFNVNGR